MNLNLLWKQNIQKNLTALAEMRSGKFPTHAIFVQKHLCSLINWYWIFAEYHSFQNVKVLLFSGENENVKYLKCFINNELLYAAVTEKKYWTNVWDVIKYLSLLSNLHGWNLHCGSDVYSVRYS